MKFNCVLWIGLVFLYWVVVGVEGQTCSSITTAQTCLQTTNCKYDFNQTVCYSGTSRDDYQQYVTQSTCSNAGYFWDQYIGHCFATLYQSNQVFPCPFFGSTAYVTADPYGAGTTSLACLTHGCVYANNICSSPTAYGNQYSFAQSNEIYASQTLFINPSVAPNTLTFSVTVAQYILQNQNYPDWNILRILNPSQNLSSLYNYFNPNCSTYNTSASAGPVPFVAQSNYPVTAANISSGFNNWNFNNDIPGTYLRQTLGYASVGAPGGLVNSAFSDGNYVYSQLSWDMNQKVQQCGQFGASVTRTANSQVFYFPFESMDRLINNGYAGMNQAFVITVPTTGSVSIAAVSNYHEQASALEVTYPQDTCTAGSARQKITYQFNVRDVFDQSKLVGPRNISDVLTQQPGATSVSNCYGDQLISFTNQGCNYATGICAYQMQTQSRCRVITPDGNAFKYCNGSSTADRISDLGSNVPYPSNLDGLHSLFINVYTCLVSGSACTLTNQSPSNVPDPITVNVAASVYTSTVITASPFTVSAGFLATPTSGISTFNALSNSSSTTNNTQFFDGNVFSYQPINTLITLPSPANTKYDLRLRIKPGNITIYPIDVFGAIVTTSNPPSLDWSSIASSALYTTKNAYATGCGALNACQTMPACSGTLGCDGFSISTAIVKGLMPALGYRFVMNYDVNIPDANGNFNPGRVLLSMGNERKLLQTSNTDPNADQRYGTVAFNVRVINNSTGTPQIIIEEIPQSGHDFWTSKEVHQVLLQAVLPAFGAAIVLYLWQMQWTYWYQYKKRV